MTTVDEGKGRVQTFETIFRQAHEYRFTYSSRRDGVIFWCCCNHGGAIKCDGKLRTDSDKARSNAHVLVEHNTACKQAQTRKRATLSKSPRKSTSPEKKISKSTTRSPSPRKEKHGSESKSPLKPTAVSDSPILAAFASQTQQKAKSSSPVKPKLRSELNSPAKVKSPKKTKTAIRPGKLNKRSPHSARKLVARLKTKPTNRSPKKAITFRVRHKATHKTIARRTLVVPKHESRSAAGRQRIMKKRQLGRSAAKRTPSSSSSTSPEAELALANRPKRQVALTSEHGTSWSEQCDFERAVLLSLVVSPTTKKIFQPPVPAPQSLAVSPTKSRESRRTSNKSNNMRQPKSESVTVHGEVSVSGQLDYKPPDQATTTKSTNKSRFSHSDKLPSTKDFMRYVMLSGMNIDMPEHLRYVKHHILNPRPV